jgi:sugar O-acyltransferase (sialic acid O-acetyltransferase NeuD family)
MSNIIAILGSGGHAKVVVDAAHLANPNLTIEIFDEDKSREGSLVAEIIVQSGYPTTLLAHVAIGNNQIRNRLGLYLKTQEQQLYSVIHPRAIISSMAQIGAGCFVAANAIVAPNASIDEGCIINHGAVVDHDCSVGAWSHIAPQVALGGGVRIGKNCLIGSGAVVLPNIQIGDYSIIGAGAVVTRSVAAHQTILGIPARIKACSKSP